jgi:multimeric flavodoxin WrbA
LIKPTLCDSKRKIFNKIKIVCAIDQQSRFILRQLMGGPMSYNILAISGSPRKNGNTELLVDAAIEPFTDNGHSVQPFFLSQKNVAPCIACEACSKDGICAVKDDAREILENITSFDAVIVGSPVYFRNVTAQLLSLFTRFHSLAHRHPFKDRVSFGGAIAVGGSPNSQGITLNIIYNFLLSMGIICVPAKLNGVSVVARERGEVLNQPESLNNANILGRNILNVLKGIKQ